MSIGEVKCKVCDNSFIGGLKAEYCSQKCKQSAYRVRKLLTYKVGDVYNSRYHGRFEILSPGEDLTRIKFISTGSIVDAITESVITKNVVDPVKRSVFGVGYLGIGKYNTVGNEAVYRIWCGMISRCYYEKSYNPTYVDCEVCEEWHNFQNFAQWYCENHPKDGLNYELDKDVSGKKIYSPDTCCFLTKSENVRESNVRRNDKTKKEKLK